MTQNVMSQKIGKKSSHRKYHNVTSLKIGIIGKYYYIQKKNLTENNNRKIIEKVQKYQNL